MKLISYKQGWAALADPAIIKELSGSIRRMRLRKNLSQAQLAAMSGINRITISRLEAGRAATLLTFVQVLRALDKLDVLNVFKEEPEISPIRLLKEQEHQRQKASPRRPSFSGKKNKRSK
jgi:putative transcriptional regulator